MCMSVLTPSAATLGLGIGSGISARDNSPLRKMVSGFYRVCSRCVVGFSDCGMIIVGVFYMYVLDTVVGFPRVY